MEKNELRKTLARLLNLNAVLMFLIFFILTKLGGHFLGNKISRAPVFWITDCAFELFVFYAMSIVYRHTYGFLQNHFGMRIYLAECYEKQKGMLADDQIPDIYEMNAILMDIITSKGKDSRAIGGALAYWTRMPLFTGEHLHFRGRRKQGKAGTRFTGHTDNFGDYTINLPEDDGRLSDVQDGKLRVGSFRVWRDQRCLFFQPFELSDPRWCDNPLDALKWHVLVFDPETANFICYGETHYTEPQKRKIWPGYIVYLNVHVLSGNAEINEFPVARFFLQYL